MAGETILIIEKEDENRRIWREALAKNGFQLLFAARAAEITGHEKRLAVDVIVLNLSDPSCGGIDLLLQLTGGDPGTGPSVIATGEPSISLAVEAMQSGAFHYLPQPLVREEIHHVLSNCLRQRRLSEENLSLKRETTLFRVIKSVSVTLDLERLLQMIMDASMEMTGANAGSLFLVDERGKNLQCEALRGVDTSPEASGLFGFQTSYLIALLNQGKSILHQGTGQRVNDLEQRALRAALFIPLKAGDKPLGLILLIADKSLPRGFTEEEVRMLKIFGGEIAGTLKNALLLKKTRELTIRDDLTEAYNRRYFESYLDEEMKRARRFGSNLSLIFMDVDNLKEVNNRFGHLMGSHVLKEVAHRIILTIRGIDKVIRYGGDEFCIILPETDTSGARRVAERIRQSISRDPIVFDQQCVVTSLTGSFGIASFPQHAATSEELLRKADRAMFEVKGSKKDGVGVAVVEGDVSSFNRKRRQK